MPGQVSMFDPEFAIVSAADTVSDFVGVCFSAIAANPFLCVLAASGLLAVGVRAFRRLRGASR